MIGKRQSVYNLPLSLVLGTIIVTALYVALNTVYLYAMPVESLKGVVNVGQVAGERLLSKGFLTVVTLAIMLAIAASINATILAGARLSYAIARDSYFYRHFEKLHARFGTPRIGLLIQAALACLYVVVDTFENLLGAVVFVMLLSSIGSGLAHVVLRWRRPSVERPYRTWGYPLVPLIFVVVYSWIAIQIFLSSPVRSLVGMAITASGIPFFLYALHRGDVRAAATFLATPAEKKDLRGEMKSRRPMCPFGRLCRHVP